MIEELSSKIALLKIGVICTDILKEIVINNCRNRTAITKNANETMNFENKGQAITKKEIID